MGAIEEQPSHPAIFCADFSAEAGEPLIGSAPRAGVWIMVEYAGVWENKAFPSSAIPQPVKEHLGAAEKSIPFTRIELIRQAGSATRGAINFFVARSDAAVSALYHFVLKTYEEILGLDIAAIAAGDERYAANLSGETLHLVCTNGRRDRCCARYGVPIYQMMSNVAGSSVWECTHLGGHRLAATVAVLPSGLVYGRVRAPDAAAILDAGQVRLENLRGRSCFAPPAQAAELFLRQQTGNTRADDMTLSALDEIGPKKWRAELTLTGRPYSVTVEQVPAGFGTYGSCTDDYVKGIEKFRLIDIA